jgi:hypothetical protein
MCKIGEGMSKRSCKMSRQAVKDEPKRLKDEQDIGCKIS